MLNKRCKPEKREMARRMRKHMTHTERMLWRQVRKKALGVCFRRQAVILGFIADFYCPSRRLIVEVDGSSHQGRERYDARRDRVLDESGIRTVRFTADEVRDDVMGCAQRLREVIDKIPPFLANLPRECEAE